MSPMPDGPTQERIAETVAAVRRKHASLLGGWYYERHEIDALLATIDSQQEQRAKDKAEDEATCLRYAERADAAERQLAEIGAQMEAIQAIVEGREPSDFLLSFPLVRAVDDLRRQLAEQGQELARVRAERDALREALMIFGEHAESCPAPKDATKRTQCNCGLADAILSSPSHDAQATLTIVETRTLLHDQSAEQQRQRDAALKRDWPDAQAAPRLPKYVSVVQREDGGVNIEGHTLTEDWELTLDALGNVDLFDRVRVAQAETPAAKDTQ